MMPKIYRASLGLWTNAPGRYDCPCPAKSSANPMGFPARARRPRSC